MPTAHSYSFLGFGTSSKNIYLISSYLCSQGPFFASWLEKEEAKVDLLFPKTNLSYRWCSTPVALWDWRMPILFLQGTSCANTPTEDFVLDEVDLMTEWQTRLLCQERIEVTKELFPVISNNQNTLKSFLRYICTHQGFLLLYVEKVLF